MQVFGICAGIASIVSVAFALWEYHRHRVLVAREEGKIGVQKERLDNILVTARVALNNLQILIRRADDTAAPVLELQNLARLIRGTLFGAYIQANELNDQLRGWKFGEHLQSDRRRSEEELIRPPDLEDGGDIMPVEEESADTRTESKTSEGV